MNLINFISYYTGINTTFITLSLAVGYFLPIIIQLFYRGFSRGLFRTTLFLWRTPLPRILLTLNIIETNKWTDEINEWIDLILENQEKIMKELNLDFVIDEENNNS